MNDELLATIREAGVECVSAVDVRCTRPDFLLQVGSVKAANLCGDIRVGEILSSGATRPVLFRNHEPIHFLSSLADSGVDCVILAEPLLCPLCMNDCREIIRDAKRAARKAVLIVVPHMRSVPGDKSSWRKEDLWALDFTASRFGEPSNEWLVGVWRKGK